jgi:transglutaminase-like putative cysteine protease
MSDVLKVGIDAMRKAMPEVKIATKPHPKGNRGVAQSVLEVNAKILEGAKDARLREWAGAALKKAGDPETTRERAQALLDAMRAQTVYVQDPPGVELVQRATMTLCLEGNRGLCLRAGDCDDLVVVFCAAAMSLGMNVKTVIQAYKGAEVYQHILCAVFDPDEKEWLKVDPSHKTWPVGMASPMATKEKEFDVMDGAKVTLTDQGDQDDARPARHRARASGGARRDADDDRRALYGRWLSSLRARRREPSEAAPDLHV